QGVAGSDRHEHCRLWPDCHARPRNGNAIARADCSSHHQCSRLPWTVDGRARAMRGTTFLGAIMGAIGMALLLLPTGAAAQFWHFGPEALVWHGNDTGGIIPWSCENEAIAQQAAAGYCAR